eukprot:COSAG01_NODE_1873_length_8995_cov_7.542299_11_plen_55_part_00
MWPVAHTAVRAAIMQAYMYRMYSTSTPAAAAKGCGSKAIYGTGVGKFPTCIDCA